MKFLPLNKSQQTSTHWLQQHFQFKKHDVAQWGSYSLLVSIDNANWANFNNRFGWGFSVEEAFEKILTDNLNNSIFQTQIRSWLGDTLFGELQRIVSSNLHK